MDNMDAAKIADSMVVEDEAKEQAEVTAQELVSNLNTEVKEAEPAKEETKAEQAQDPEKARKDAISEGLNSLMEEGVTSEELLAFSQDATARKDVQAGKDVVRAFMAYSRRQASAVKEVPVETAKKSVPTVKTQGTAEPSARDTIKNMSKADFAELSRRAREAIAEGRKVTFK